MLPMVSSSMNTWDLMSSGIRDLGQHCIIIHHVNVTKSAAEKSAQLLLVVIVLMVHQFLE